MIEFGTSESEQILIETADKFAKQRLRDSEREREKRQEYGAALIKEYAEVGFASMGLPESLGGSELPFAIQLTVWERLAAADPGAPLGLDPIGPAARCLAQSESGRDIVQAGLPGAIVVAEDVQSRGASGTIPWVPAIAPRWLALIHPDGVSLIREPTCRALEARPCGLQACGGVEIQLEETVWDNIGDNAQAVELRTECRLFAAAVMLGAARDAIGYALTYAQERVAFGKPIAHHQGLAFMLMDCATDIDAAGLLLHKAGASMHPGESALAHSYVHNVALRVAERSVQALGGHGYLYDHPVEKRMRDIRAIASLYGGAAAACADAGAAVFDLPTPIEVAQ